MEIIHCSLCGAPTEFEGGTKAQWYLCEKCEGTKEAERKGFVHNINR